MRINVFKSGGNSAQGGFVSNGLTLQGPLVLSGPHSEPLHAVPKQYVDNAAYNLDATNITSGVLAGARMPAFSGDATTILGTTNIVLNNTGVTAGSILKPTVTAKGRIVSGGVLVDSDISQVGFNKITSNKPTTLAGYGISDGINLNTNNVLSGPLTLNANPTSDGHAATKQYVDSAAGNAGGISVGDIIRKPFTTTPSGFLKCNGGEVEKSVYAGLYSVIGDRFNTSTDNTGGRPWQFQYDVNKVQSSELIGWSTSTAGSSYAYRSVVVTKNRVYLIGGYNGSGTIATVETAVINADGSLGTWGTATSLPGILHGATTIVTTNRVYLIGGYNAGGVANIIYTAPISSDGTIGTWTTGPSMPSVLAYSRAILIKNKIYTIGGRNASSPISTIYVCTLNTDGSMGTWSAYGSFPISIYNNELAIIKNRLYSFGGYSSTALNTVYYSEIASDGSLGTWTALPGLPIALYASQVFVTKSVVYMVGGWNSSAVVSDIYSAFINSDGSLGMWSKAASLPGALSVSCLFATAGKLYIGSGYNVSGTSVNTIYSVNINGGLSDYSAYYGGVATTTEFGTRGAGKPWSQQYQINTTFADADVGSWTAQSSNGLTANLDFVNLIVTKNKAYIIGTKGSATTSYSATINSDGTLTSWSISNTLFNIGSKYYGAGCVVTKNRVYLIGGNNGGAVISTIYTAAINSDGTLGSFAANAISLPVPVAYAAVFIIKNRLYVCGGGNANTDNTNGLDSVYYATIDNDGVIGAFTSDTSLPVALSSASLAVLSDRVYLIGGYANNAATNSVYYAMINANGSLAAWTVGTALPVNITRAATYVSKNKIWLIGCRSASSVLNYNFAAAINTDGTLGAWTALTGNVLSNNDEGGAVFATSTKLVFVSGVGTAHSQLATLTGGINDTTSYYDGTYNVSILPNYQMPGSGKPWFEQYQINTTQASDLTWTAGTAFPIALRCATSFVTNDYAYLVGGINAGGTYLNTVYKAPINSDGSLGAWTGTTNFPVGNTSANIFVANNKVYVIGGHTGVAYSNSIYAATINSDGSIGAWTLLSVTAPTYQGAAVFVTRNRVYHIGGYNGSVHTSSIYYAHLYADGSISSFVSDGSAAGVIYAANVIVTKNYVYFVSGYNGSAWVTTTYYVPINADGSIGSWSTGNSLPVIMGWAGTYVSQGRAYIFGGTNGTTPGSAVYYANINADGTLGSWVAGTSLPISMDSPVFFAAKSKLHVGTGYTAGPAVTANFYSASLTTTTSSNISNYSPYYNGSIVPLGLDSELNITMAGSGQPWTHQYQFNNTQAGDISGWATDTSFPVAIGAFRMFITKNRVYSIGGYNGSGGSVQSNIIYSAPINTDGTLGTWAQGTNFPIGVVNPSVVVAKNKVYVLGGLSTAPTPITSIYTASINSDGTIGTWVLNASTLPVGITSAEVAIIRDNIYIMGGHNGSGYLNTVYTCSINADGTLGTWSSSGNLTYAFGTGCSAVTNNRIYLFGGYTGSASMTSIMVANVNNDGSLTAWSTYSLSLPVGISHNRAVVTKNYVYIFGGFTSGNTSVSTIYRAPISANGVIGQFVAGSSLPTALNAACVIVTKNKVSFIGGRTDGGLSWVSSIYSATFAYDTSDYSSYYDGTIIPASLANSKFKLPDYSMIDKEYGELVTSYIKY